MKRIVMAFAVLAAITMLVVAFTVTSGCEDVRWVEGLDGEPLAQCYDDL
jgi:hypothetical protein